MSQFAQHKHNQPDLNDALEAAHATYRAKHAKSLMAYDGATKVMPGGNTRSVLYHEPFPFRACEGAGATLSDVDGNRYLNLLGEYSAGLFGHDDPTIRAAVVGALDGGINLGAHNGFEPEFAALVCARFPSIDMVRFTNSGTEANLMAITTARIATGRGKLLVFEGGYHGGAFYFKPGVVTNAPFPWIVTAYNDVEGAVAAIRAHGDDLAAVLVEPMMGSAGCIPGSAAFLGALREECTRVGSLLIFDEVMTSRLAPGGAQALYGITPDLTTLGKWIGGGMSFGAFGGREDLMALYDPRRPDALPHAGTFNNNVLTMAAGIAALSQIYTPERAIAHNARGDALRDRINQIVKEEGVALTASGIGSLMNLHPTAAALTNYRDTAALDDRLRALLFFDLLDAGFYNARRGYMALSLAVGDDDIDAFTEALRALCQRRAPLFAIGDQ
jgi:glutamate-1-semialdehyde 2,1-aminomutase